MVDIAMKTLQIASYAKVNLYLDIVNRREDGYHLLEMVNAKISLQDTLTVMLEDKPGIRLTLSDPRLPTGPENTVYKAAAFFAEATGYAGGIRIHVEKRIPFGAGLGGGSSNAGALLRALNEATGANLTPEQLIGIGQRIGADVPFFFLDGCCRLGGIGEQVERIDVPDEAAIRPIYVVLCSPEESVSTKVAYGLWDESTDHRHSSPRDLIQALSQGRLENLHSHLFNSFEAVIYPAFPGLGRIYDFYRTVSPTKPLLSGSGSNLFSLHDSQAEAEAVTEQLQTQSIRAGIHSLVL